MNEDVYYIRGFQDGDEKQILTLFKTVFGQRRDVDTWKWMFKNNPYGRIYAGLAFSKESHELIGQYTVIPTPINHRGNKVIGCQSVDTMVHPEFRKYGLFVKTAEYCYQELQKDGVKIVFGFPNHNSYPGFMRKLKWERIEYQTRYFHRLGSYREKIAGSLLLGRFANLGVKFYLIQILKYKIRNLKKQLGSVELHFSRTVPNEYEAFWQCIRSYDVCSIWKDSAYFQWRYDSSPRNDFIYAYLTQKKKIIALAVYDPSSMTVCELMAKHRNCFAAQLLIYEICIFHARREAKGISFLGSDQGFFDEAFSHFERSKAFYRVLCLRALQSEDNCQDFLLPHSWTATHGDTDLI
nr:GNAT family N-acetyltransferase [uncultured Desulfobacter sp.]